MFFSHMDSQATARSSRPSRAKCWPMLSQAIWVALTCSRPYRIDPFRAGSALPDRWQRSAFSGMLFVIDYRTCRRRCRFLIWVKNGFQGASDYPISLIAPVWPNASEQSVRGSRGNISKRARAYPERQAARRSAPKAPLCPPAQAVPPGRQAQEHRQSDPLS
jgi:hypothetical protein